MSSAELKPAPVQPFDVEELQYLESLYRQCPELGMAFFVKAMKDAKKKAAMRAHRKRMKALLEERKYEEYVAKFAKPVKRAKLDAPQ